MAKVRVERRVWPEDLNWGGILHGGNLVKFMDETAGDLARVHTGKVCVTLCIDSLHFHRPVEEGETLIIHAAINRVWDSSMEVGVRVESRDCDAGECEHVASGYFVFVAIDRHKRPIPADRHVAVETEEEKRRFRQASDRRKRRLDSDKSS